jgi:hypothetical protein
MDIDSLKAATRSIRMPHLLSHMVCATVTVPEIEDGAGHTKGRLPARDTHVGAYTMILLLR